MIRWGVGRKYWNVSGLIFFKKGNKLSFTNIGVYILAGVPSLSMYVRWPLVTYSARGVLGVELFTTRRVDSGVLTHLPTFNILQCLAIGVCPLKWIYELYSVN